MCILLTNIVAHVKDQGSWAQDLLVALSVESKKNLLSIIGKAGIDHSLSDRHSSGTGCKQQGLGKCHSCHHAPTSDKNAHECFIDDILDQYWPWLIQSWTLKEIEMIKMDHQELVKLYQTEPGYKERDEKQDHSTLFHLE
jgi:hypothetical protein